MLGYTLSTTKIPTYLDGRFEIFEITQEKKGDFPIEYIQSIDKSMWFNELSISDKIKFELEQRKRAITLKLRIPETKELTSLHVLKINDTYHKVYNAYHFTNKEGYKETDITLEEYPNPRIKENK